MFDPYPVYAALGAACAGVPDFSVTPRLVVGTFSYAKLPMVADLAAQGDALADHDVVAALAGDPDALRAVRSELDRSRVDLDDPERDVLVLDADSSQQEAIEAVRSGSHLVVHGPPGTGKSQTIANLIATLAADGKRVLFVAEKRAAIDAVVGRLDRVGLGDLVLDLHGGATGAVAALAGARRGPRRASDAADPDTSEVERTLLERRTRLTDHATALHERREPWGVSAYDAQVELTRLTHRRNAPTSRVRIHGEALRAVSRDRVRERPASSPTRRRWAPDHHPADNHWYAAHVASVRRRDTRDPVRAEQRGPRAQERSVRCCRRLGCRPPPGRPTGGSVDLAERVRQTRTLRPEVFAVPLTDVVGATATRTTAARTASSSRWFTRLRLRRQARALPRAGPAAGPTARRAPRAQEQAAGLGSSPAAAPARRPRRPGRADRDWSALRPPGVAVHPPRTHARRSTWRRSRCPTCRPARSRRPRRPAGRLPRAVAVLDRCGPPGSAAGRRPRRRGVAVDDVAPEMERVWWISLLDDVSVRDPRYGTHDGPLLRRVGRTTSVPTTSTSTAPPRGCGRRSGAGSRPWPTTPTRRPWSGPRRRSRAGTCRCASCCPGPARR